jgi:predicted dehydrogenase
MNPPQSVDVQLKVAVIGVGARAQSHLATLEKLTDMYKLVGVCDVLPERVAEVAARLGVPGFSDLETLFARSKPDAVVVITPAEHHHTATTAAAAHGVHVLCETPIAVTLGYADQMISACRRAGVQLEIGENVWRWPQERLKYQLIQGGLIGDVSSGRLWYSSGAYHGLNALRTLVDSRAARIVGYAKVMAAPRAVRFVDPYFLHGLGYTEYDYEPLIRESDIATWEAGLIEFANGVVATYEVPFAPPRGNLWDIQGTKGAISGTDVIIHDSKERLRITLDTETIEGRPTVVGAALTKDGERLSEWAWENPYVRYFPANADEVARMDALTGLYRAVTEGVSPEYGADNARADMEILIAVRESARRGGQPLTLPLHSETGYEERLHATYGEPA